MDDFELCRELESYIEKEDLPELLQGVVEIIGLNKTLEIVHEFAGDYIYIPTSVTITKPARNRRIRKEFNGGNYAELGRRYSMCERQIRFIIHGK